MAMSSPRPPDEGGTGGGEDGSKIEVLRLPAPKLLAPIFCLLVFF